MWSSMALAQVDFEQPPIDYLKAQPDDVITKLQARIDAGEVELKRERGLGYLRSVLDALNVPASSQALVYSKTSFQLRRISPRTPRAIYFGDEVYVGWVRGSDVMEFSAVDPKLGANFYTLSQNETGRPQFRRHTHTCLQCHGSSLTKGVPGHMVRSVYSKADGQPVLGAGTYRSDHTSPLKERWGGWYVTGQHGSQRHLGNLFVNQVDNPREADLDSGANVTDLKPYFRTAGYLSGHSDIVALMVLEHQTTMHNLITRANFLTQITLRDAAVMNKMLERSDDFCSESNERRINNAAEPVVKYLLFAGEARLTAPIVGTSNFAEEFATGGPRDKQERSLRELDLRGRLFKYPCSYLIYSAAFDELPAAVKTRIYQRLWDVLTGEDTSEDFQHLTPVDRQAILAILRDTKQGLPEYWRRGNDE
ncbi:MAG: hypothetical protein CMJ64_13655 [Planctomycetaceae bacterium]|nr:hypothetical protein [Planctomycetaceae bacterium]